MKTLKIEIPKGYQIDEEKSTFTNIVFKPIEKWVDLGLPSGTLWCDTNEEGYYTYDEAIDKFTNNIPDLIQIAELLQYCEYKWDSNKKGGLFTGPNGNTLFFPAAGYRDYNNGDAYGRGSDGYYWSSKPYYYYRAYGLGFNNGNANMNNNNRAYGYSVRLVKRK